MMSIKCHKTNVDEGTSTTDERKLPDTTSTQTLESTMDFHETTRITILLQKDTYLSTSKGIIEHEKECKVICAYVYVVYIYIKTDSKQLHLNLL